MKDVKEEKKCPCEQCMHGAYMIIEKEWWCDKHLKYASQMERNRRCEKFETISGGDAISRQAVLDIVKFEEDWLSDAKSNNADTDIAFSGIRTQVAKLSPVTKALEPCEDCISRKALLDKAWDVPYDGKYIQVVDVGDIEELPSVTPARKKGEWCKQNDDYNDWYECSECGYGSEGEMQYSSEYDVRTNYCPHCGCKMESRESNLW